MANPKLSAGEMETQGIFTFVKKLRWILLEHPFSRVIVLWDGRSWRRELYPEYKANREKTKKQEDDRKAYYDQAQEMRTACRILGVRQLWAANLEADDLAYSLTKKLNSAGVSVPL